MGLNYNLTKIKNYETVTAGNDEHSLSAVTDGLIFSTMTIGLGSITEKNVNEWVVRLALSDKLFGTVLKIGGEDRPISREEIVAHIGLSCNVSDETRAKWVKRMTDRFMKDEEYKLRKVA